MSDSGFLARHIEYLLFHDTSLRAFWSELREEDRWQYVEMFHLIEQRRTAHAGQIDKTHLQCAKQLQAEFASIAQVPIDFDKIGDFAALFIRDLTAKHEALAEVGSSLTSFVQSSGLEKSVYWYGRLKSEISLNQKLMRLGTPNSDSPPEKHVLDAVRFRMVASDTPCLLLLAGRLKAHLSQRLLACRNYISWPRFGLPVDQYKAIHFIVLTSDTKCPVEIQVMTRAREAVSLLDHHVAFKGQDTALSSQQRDWLSGFSSAANILDSQRLGMRK